MTLLIGIGNRDRGDDGAGIEAARYVANLAPSVTVLESRGEAAELIEAWKDADIVYAIDCCVSQGVPGMIHRFEAHEAPLPEKIGAVSSHGIGLGTAIELARVMNLLPRRLIVFAIEGKKFKSGAPLSAPVADAALRAAQTIAAEL